MLPDPDALHVHELADAELRELAPVARALDASEGEARVRLDEPVHEHGARLDERREALGALPARGPEGRAEPEGGVVREADGVLLIIRAAAAVLAARGRSASSRTMNGSLPPSSSTVFLSSRPARSATWLPARSLPVSVTARMRASAMSAGTAAGPTSTVPNRPSGRPAARKTPSISSAQCGTLEACFKIPAL